MRRPFASQKGTFNCSYYYEPFNINDIEQEHIFKNQYFIANFIQQIVTFGIRCLLYFHKPPPGINEDIINALCPPAGRLSPPLITPQLPPKIFQWVEWIKKNKSQIDLSIFEKWFFPGYTKVKDVEGKLQEYTVNGITFFTDPNKYSENRENLLLILGQLRHLLT